MSSALPRYMYKNPCDVLEQKQQHELRKSCVGCAHSFRMQFKKGVEMGCEKGRRYGKRCKYYEVIK